ncbi:MAG: SpoIID/LytB domain-containing protein [Thiomicrorhabdus sp.]|nr:SpoIID/LytB domain-containing protein [Thiomicrorhabdus sp.]
MESYLPGVLEKELYSSWEPGTFVAQAVAARSYAITEHYKHSKLAKRFFDLESTTASQAYVGLNASSRAREAVAQTRGLVLSYKGRIVPGYYSSCCGGSSQDAAIAFPHGPDIAPLRGLRRAGWCHQSKRYRWGPLSREIDALGRRMVAWAVKNKHPLAQLKRIVQIQVTKFNRSGRPALFIVLDTTGKRYSLTAESFRFACNANAPGLGKLKSHAKLYSSHVQVQVVGDKVQFTDGRGFGHGVGMCQFGAEAMAQNGIDPAQILSYYYPQSILRRAY